MRNANGAATKNSAKFSDEGGRFRRENINLRVRHGFAFG